MPVPLGFVRLFVSSRDTHRLVLSISRYDEGDPREKRAKYSFQGAESGSFLFFEKSDCGVIWRFCEAPITGLVRLLWASCPQLSRPPPPQNSLCDRDFPSIFVPSTSTPPQWNYYSAAEFLFTTTIQSNGCRFAITALTLPTHFLCSSYISLFFDLVV